MHELARKSILRFQVIDIVRGYGTSAIDYKTETVADYVAAIGGDKKQALRDLAWDSKQQWIEVVGAGPTGSIVIEDGKVSL